MKNFFETWEVAFIYLVYPEFTNAEIAQHLNRTIGSIQIFAYRHKLKKPAKHPRIKPNDRYGKLTVIKQSLRKTGSNRGKHWLCRCDCGDEGVFRGDGLINGKISTCGCQRYESRYGVTKYVSRSFFCIIRQNARRRGLEFGVTLEDLDNLFEQQKCRCALTGESLTIKTNIRQAWQDKSNTASLDRIDSNTGYVKGNIRWISKEVNRLKWNLTDTQLLNLCHKIIKHAKRS